MTDPQCQCSPLPPPKRYRVPVMERLRVGWQNWKVRKTGRALRRLCQSMRDDPGYADTWYCNIACVIFDSNVCNQKQAEIVAARLMSHLFKIEIHPK